MRTLLIVDDNVELASLLAVVAEVHGFAPRVAHTGLQALDLIEREAPEAALVDLHLPDIAGQDLLKALKARGVIAFAMSGVFRGEQFVKAAMETYGVRAYFEKPFAARDAMMKMVGMVNAPRSAAPAPLPVAEPRPVASAHPEPQLPLIEALIAKAQAEIAAQAIARATPPPPPPADAPVDDVPSVEALIAKQESAAAPVEPAAPGAEAAASRSVPPLDAMDTAETTGIFASAAGKPFEAEITIEPIPAVAAAAPEPPPAAEEPPAAEAEARPPAEEPPPVVAEKVPARPPPLPADAHDDLPEPVEAAPAPPAPEAAPEPAAPAPIAAIEAAPAERRDSWPAPTSLPRRDDPSLEGPLPIHPGTVAGLLSRLSSRRATGELRIKRGEVLKVIGLRDGQIVFAASNLSNERLPRWALRTGKLPANRVQELQAELKKGVRTSDALVALGIVAESERIKLVASLVREIVWTVLDAEGGEAVFVTRAPVRKGLLPLAFDPVALVLSGYRQVFSLVRLRELVDPDKRYVQLADAPWQPEELSLSAGEGALFAAADGSKALEDLVLLSELEEREALVALVALSHLGLLEARPPPRRRIVLA